MIEPDLKWDRRFMQIAAVVGRDWGYDDGAVIVDANHNTLCSVGYFALPRKMRVSKERLSNEEFMAAHGVSAVERAVLSLMRPPHEPALTLYCWPRMIGLGDARLAIEAGIKRVVVPPIVGQRSLEEAKVVRAVLKEVGIRVDICSADNEPAPDEE